MERRVGAAERLKEPRGVAINLRPVGNPMPLAFFALAAATFSLSALQLGWIPPAQSKDVALIMIGFVVPFQLIATIFGFLSRDGAAAEAMGMLSGTWFVVGLVTLTSPPGSTSNALGIFLLVIGLQLLAPALSSLPTKSVAAAVFAAVGIRFAFTGVYELTASGTWEDVAGIVGLVLFVLAAYAGLALTLADARHGHGPLPVGRGSDGSPVTSDPSLGVEDEPGVRPQL